MLERPTYELLEDSEHCHRHGVYSRDWLRAKLSPAQLLAQGIREGLTTDSKDWGQEAGNRVYELAATHEIDSKQMDVHSEAVHICSLADILSVAVRKKEPWKTLGPVEVGNGGRWENDAYLDPSGAALRRIVCVSSWSDERHYGVCRSWGTMGTMCLSGMSMKIAVCILGSHRDGHYHSPWSKGLLHPINRKVKFRKKSEGQFKSSWIPVWREDRSEISTNDWLDGMLSDGVLQDHLILIDVPLPERKIQREICDLAKRKLETIYQAKELPEKQLSTCFWPIPCEFKGPCHSDQPVSRRFGFVPLNEID